MAETIAITCPECDKTMSVPAKLAGKKVRCKGCEAVVPVPEPKAKETFKLKEEEPRQKKPEPEKKPADALDDDPSITKYDVTPDDTNVVRCVFCAQPLDPPDSRVCKNCGFDLRDRRRHESRSVHENTFGDYLNYHATTIGAFLFILALIGLNIYCISNMAEWFEGSWFEIEGEKDPTTNKPKFYVNPGLGSTWICITSLFLSWYAGRFILRKLKAFHPRERLTK